MASVFRTAVSADSTPRRVTYAQLHDDEFEYSMRNRKRGLVFIVNNYIFNNKLPNRDFSGLDRDALISALKFTGFRDEDVKLHENQTKTEIQNLVTSAASEDYTRIGCLIFIVLSHGDEHMFYGTDYGCLAYEDLLEPIRTSKNRSLQGVPKLLLVQACKLSEGTPTHPYQVGPPNEQRRITVPDENLQNDAAVHGENNAFSTTARSDVIIAYSTIPGTPGGSRFIQAFCEVMKKDGRRLEVTEILARTSRIMSYTPGTSMPSKSLLSPCVISQLKKGLFFT